MPSMPLAASLMSASNAYDPTSMQFLMTVKSLCPNIHDPARSPQANRCVA